MYKRFNKGEIVPYEIIDRMPWNYDKVKFGVDAELRDNILYPVYPLKKGQSLVNCISSIGTIKCTLSHIPYNDIMIRNKALDIPLIDDRIYYYGDFNYKRR